MRFQMMNNAHPPGWALFVLWSSWATTCRLGAGHLVEGWDEQGAEASAGAGVGKVDGVRLQGWRVSIGRSSPAVIASSFFSGAVLLIACVRVLAWLLAAVGRAISCTRCCGS